MTFKYTGQHLWWWGEYFNSNSSLLLTECAEYVLQVSSGSKC